MPESVINSVLSVRNDQLHLIASPFFHPYVRVTMGFSGLIGCRTLVGEGRLLLSKRETSLAARMASLLCSPSGVNLPNNLARLCEESDGGSGVDSSKLAYGRNFAIRG